MRFCGAGCFIGGETTVGAISKLSAGAVAAKIIAYLQVPLLIQPENPSPSHSGRVPIDVGRCNDMNLD
jgi:hypothetical protein